MKLLSRYFFPILLLLITLIICYQNYTPGTWLTGWDTLHPEFNFPLNFQRVLFGSLRTDQGLSAVPAHAHMSELPRIILLWISSIIFPVSFLRYLYMFACFILGPFGVYIFLKRIILKNIHWSSAGAFLGSLFYIFNLGTVQHFYVPFEMFPTQFAALGWLFYFATEYIQHRKKKYILAFALTSFFAAPMAYAFLLWYAYAGGLVLYLGSLVLLKRSKIIIKSSLLILIVTFATNAFWLLPNWYFIATHAKEVPQSQINRLFSDEAFLHNKQYGNLADSMLFKNFLFNWYEQTGEGLNQQQEVLASWKMHIEDPYVRAIGYAAFYISILGIVVAVTRKQTYALALGPVGAFALVMIINMNPPFSYLFDPLREHISLFREGLRLPWTKFSLLTMFTMSIFFGIGVHWLIAHFSDMLQKKYAMILAVIPVVALSTGLLIYGKPMFDGYLIDPQMRVAIPERYFEMFNWFETQKQVGRVAPLPMHSIWGWEYYDWGFQGAGFSWFGIKYPVLARDFDRWNPANEAYFREMSTALYARDVTSVENIMRKYQIAYLVLDESVLFPKNKPNALWIQETKSLLSRSDHIRLTQQFGDTLSVYVFDEVYDSLVSTPLTYTEVGPRQTGGYTDQASMDQGVYIESSDPNKFYPARSMIDRFNRLRSDTLIFASDSAALVMEKPVGFEILQDQSNIVPEYFTNLGYDFSLDESAQITETPNKLLLQFPLTSEPVFLNQQPVRTSDCGGGVMSQRRYSVSDYVVFSSLNGSSCDYVPFDALSHNAGQILLIESRYVEGLPLRLCVTDQITRRCDLYTTLDKHTDWQRYIFVLPPFPTDSRGYEVHLNTVSLGDTRSTNEVRSVQMMSIPYHRWLSLALSDLTNPESQQNSVQLQHVTQLNPLLYRAELNQQSITKEGLLVLNFAYENGWQAFIKTSSFPFFARLEHTQVNNWANGWKLEPSGISHQQSDCLKAVSCKLTAYILFWPQILEFLGLGGLLFCVGMLVYWKRS